MVPHCSLPRPAGSRPPARLPVVVVQPDRCINIAYLLRLSYHSSAAAPPSTADARWARNVAGRTGLLLSCCDSLAGAPSLLPPGLLQLRRYGSAGRSQPGGLLPL